jgi:hypothetical protein
VSLVIEIALAFVTLTPAPVVGAMLAVKALILIVVKPLLLASTPPLDVDVPVIVPVHVRVGVAPAQAARTGRAP